MCFFRPLLAVKNPQRVFVILFALCVCCLLCGAVCADNITWPKQVEIFALEKKRVPLNMGNVEQNIKVELVYVPYFLFADGVMVAFAEGEHMKNGNRNSIIVARYIETEGKNWTRRVTDNNGANWKTQLAMHENVENKSSNFFMNNFMAATNENKIYLFVLNINWPVDSVNKSFIQSFELYFSVGEIKTSFTAQGREKIIEWQSLDEQADNLTQTIKRELPNATLYAGTVSFIIEKKIIFVFEAYIDGEDVSVFVSSNDIKKTSEWDVSYVYTPKECYNPNFVMWKNELLMFPNNCVDGKQIVMKSLDMGKTWTPAEPSFARLSNYINYEEDFTVTTINNKTTLMYTQEVVRETSYGKWFDIHLWISDGNHVINIGPIVADSKRIIPIGIVYANGELFFMYQKWDNNQHKKVIVSYLYKELKIILLVLNTWDNVDKYLSKPCNKTAGQNALLDTLCATPVPIDGLFGFFSDGVDNNTYWRNKYLYGSAIVKGGTKVTNGFTFIGAGAGAIWRLVQKEELLYQSFVEYGLTAVTTVRIHSALGNNTPLLTVGGDSQGAERQGLWYGSDGHWRVMYKGTNGVVPAAGGWEINKTYCVALLMRNNTIAAYVNGNFVGSNVLRITVPKSKPFGFLHLFIAGYEDNDGESTLSNVTVTNFLLYNRQLNETEMRAMSGTLES